LLEQSIITNSQEDGTWGEWKDGLSRTTERETLGVKEAESAGRRVDMVCVMEGRYGVCVHGGRIWCVYMEGGYGVCVHGGWIWCVYMEGGYGVCNGGWIWCV
jgi:hypothetical protein